MWKITRNLLAFFIVASVVLKIVKHAQSSLVINPYLLDPDVLSGACIVGLEAAIAALIIQLRDRQSWVLCFVVYSLFALISAYSLAFSVDCGCFGDLSNEYPFLPLAIDVGVIFWLVCIRRIVFHAASGMKNQVTFVPFLCFTGVFVISAAVQLTGVANGKPVWMEREVMGKSIASLLSQSDFRESGFEVGDQAFLVLDRGCGRCEYVAGKVRSNLLFAGAKVTLAWIDSPTSWSVYLDKGGRSFERIDLTWPPGSEPYVLTPFGLVLNNGRVESVLNSEQLTR